MSNQADLSMPQTYFKGKFVRGPIPLSMIKAAIDAGRGKGLGVLMALLHRCWRKNTRRVCLSGQLLSTVGIQRHSGYRGLADLEDAGLVTVERRGGRSPMVTIIFPDWE